MNRRGFLAALGCLGFGAPPAVLAQSHTKIPRLGWLGANSEAAARHLLQSFLQSLREFGYVEGQNVLIERRWAEGQIERLPALADELVELKVDVIVAPPTSAAVAARKATKTIPIVFALAADPVGNGLVESLARPGGNATGLSTVNVELGAKRLELLKEAFPRISRVAVLHNSADTSNQLQLKMSLEAAKVLGVTLVPIGMQRPEDLDPAFATVTKHHADAIFVMENPANFTTRKPLVSFVQRARLPAIYALREFVDDGGLMAYAVSTPDQFRRAAVYVAKILKGAKPGDLPVEQPTKFELVINLKTAKALGLTLAPSVLVRADEIIR